MCVVVAIEKNGHDDVMRNENELSVKSRLCVRGDCVLRVAALSVRKSRFRPYFRVWQVLRQFGQARRWFNIRSRQRDAVRRRRLGSSAVNLYLAASYTSHRHIRLTGIGVADNRKSRSVTTASND
ncbi:hypothetical protein PD5205_02760 [Xanthomonas fragariae]|uniref:Uncharacterized protein n=2 Tax=Xanthomonas fragariae TaxID=48664 RepID=A0A1Y6HP78_9XANT|nr:hypothetical protein [Xanthomonas fragariae]MBL9196606.1 hypothetical protein [Xanthomonas fragariae]MBL9221501.1 hypothetical protein [Xanthomonas fragariae]MEA5185967.1 hypothetical protein [Xanthomonas fragariae]MEA5232058.1 hypothetical protein [Xanthomonas fragariae]WIY73364.1 hypothetical protein OW158_06210 [Xanthomonas fragariae]